MMTLLIVLLIGLVIGFVAGAIWHSAASLKAKMKDIEFERGGQG